MAFLKDYLNENPRAAFQSFMPGLQMPLQRFFSGMYDDIYDEYQGQLGLQARQGQEPNMNFTGFLHNYPFFNRYMAFSPEQRGWQSRNFAPRTKFLNYG